MKVKKSHLIKKILLIRSEFVFLFIVFNFFLIILIVNPITESQSPEKNSKIFGYVIDASTDKPIAELTIFVTNENVSYAQTDIKGYYEIELQHEGNFKLNVHLNGYFSYETDFNIQSGQHLELNISLKPLPKESSILKGYVFNSIIKTPINNWKVYVSGENYYNETITNKSGYYQINVPPGNYWVSLNGGDSYYNYNNEFTISQGEVKELNLSIEPLPKRVSQVNGYISDNFTNEPIFGLDVILSEEWHSSKTITDNNGYYVIEIWEGNFLLWIYAEDYLNYECRINVGSGESFEQNITLESRNPTPIIDRPLMSKAYFTNDKINFLAESSKDIDGEIKNYYWNFGDGTFGDGVKTKHSYSSKGTYTVSLNVTDEDGRYRIAQIEIIVKEKLDENFWNNIYFQIIFTITIVILIILIILINYKKRKHIKHEKKKFESGKKPREKTKLKEEDKRKVEKTTEKSPKNIEKSRIKRKKELRPKKRSSVKKLHKPQTIKKKEKISEEVEWEEDEDEEVEWK